MKLKFTNNHGRKYEIYWWSSRHLEKWPPYWFFYVANVFFLFNYVWTTYVQVWCLHHKLKDFPTYRLNLLNLFQCLTGSFCIYPPFQLPVWWFLRKWLNFPVRLKSYRFIIAANTNNYLVHVEGISKIALTCSAA